MSKHEALVRYRHMLDNAYKVRELTIGKSRQDLDTDWVRTLALVRLLEVIGEAANRVPAAEQSLRPQVPWSQLVGLRNRLIHGYDSIDLDILYQIVSSDIPPLIQILETIVSGYS